MSTQPLVSSPAHLKIDALAKRYAARRERVRRIVLFMEGRITAIHRRASKVLNRALAVAVGADAALRAEIEANRGLFVKPKTWVLHGIQVGLRKGTGRLNWECEDDELVKRIEKRFKDDQSKLDACVKTTKKPIVAGLETLDAKDLAALGVTIESTGEIVFVKAVETDTEKLTKRLLKEGARGEE
jgi:hypothetical protein